MKYRKKPVVVEAIKWTGENVDEVKAFFGNDRGYMFCAGSVCIDTLEGRMRTNIGDMIIKGVAGEFYPCKPDIFAATYEPVTESDEPQRFTPTRVQAEYTADLQNTEID